MNTEFFTALIINASLLISLSLVYHTFFYKKWKRNILFNIFLGIIIGLMGIVLLMNSVPVSTGIIFDTRSILVSVMGLFFGFIPTVIAVVIISGYRLFLGGGGAFTGVLVTVLTAGVGLIWHQFRLSKILQRKKLTWLEFYLFGLLTHVVMLACLLTLPAERIISSIQAIYLPVLILYPLVSLILCMIAFYALKNQQTEEDLKASELRFRTMFEQAPIGIVIQYNHKTHYRNSMYEKILGRTQEEIAVEGWENFTHADDLREDLDQLEKLWSGAINEYSMIKRYYKPDGELVWANMVVSSLRINNQTSGNYVCMIQDITERKHKEEEIIYLNHHDVLTSLYNRTFFDDAVIRFDNPEQLPLSIIIGDINGLKFVNDAFGHAKGDILLIEMAKILTSCCRPEDIVARTGGDEFCILLPGTNGASARKIVEMIKKTCEEYVTQLDKETYYASISLGYETKISPDENFGDIQQLAEEHMYRHKLLEHKSLHSAIISSIKTTMYEKSNETEEHAERMAELSKKLGRAMDFNENDLVSLELVTTLHDIGKISIDQTILDKPGALSQDEWVEIRKHPDVGYRIALTVPELSRIAEYILCHHERWDGQGYPQQLAGTEIPLISRMLTVVDAYDAMTQDRAYRKAMSKDAAIAELKRNAGTQFDPRIVEIFIEKVLVS